MFTHIRSYAAAFALAAVVIPVAPITAQDSEALKALDAQLPGDLANDPSRIDWQSYGVDLEASAVVDPSIPGGGAARRFEVKSAARDIYAAGTNVPLTKKVRRGEQVTIGFYARTIDADTEDGRGEVRVRFQENAQPYRGFGEQTLTIGNDWQWYEVTASSELPLDTRSGIVALQFGRTRQTLEIGQAIVVSGADKIAGEGPVSVAAARADVPELEMPDALKGTGTLLNNPGQATWKFGGSTGTYSNRDEPEIWMMKATRFEVAQPGTGLADLYATVPIQQAIAKDDKLTITIVARTISSEAEDGKAVAGSSVQGTAPPFESFAANRFKIGSQWQLIKIETQAPRDYSPGGAELQLYFGGSQQQVDLGPVYVFKTG